MKRNSEYLWGAIKMILCSAGSFVIFYFYYDSGVILSRGADTNAVDDPFEFWLIVTLFFSASIASLIYSLHLFIKYFDEE